jgi:hypothetical protein
MSKKGEEERPYFYKGSRRAVRARDQRSGERNEP